MATADSIRELMKSHTITYDIYDMLLGKKIGGGMSRQVYECFVNPKLVIKIESPGANWQNVKEWEVFWEASHDKNVKKWFAPVEFISDCGTVLAMKKCEPLRKDELPKMVPKFLTDLKLENFGMYEGRVVCLDYGTFMYSKGFDTKMKKANWWSDYETKS